MIFITMYIIKNKNNKFLVLMVPKGTMSKLGVPTATNSRR